MSARTYKGSNIADQIQGEDAYGYNNKLTTSDLYNILDQFQTHIMDIDENAPLVKVLSKWMDELFTIDPDMELP